MNELFAWLVLLVPVLAVLLITLFSLHRPALSAALSIGACGLSFLFSLPLITATLASPHGNALHYFVPWLGLGEFRVNLGIRVDGLSAAMLLVVTFVGLLIHIYSIGYMKGEQGFTRFFAQMSLFMFSMLGVVLADNFVMIFIFWELVGLSSYLLIGYDYHRTAAADAGKKAFLVNRVGDFGFILGIVLLFSSAGTVDFNAINLGIAAGTYASAPLLAAAVFIFMGALAKSAQFPLHVWLPDAMEGPTPVSALIHAATMVAAGVYLLARTAPLFAAEPMAMTLVAYIGGFTALFAATIAIVQNDIKRILAYSTLSQLGYMVMAVGLGAVSAGMFHLTTHAFFKALLFLGAGSIIHAFHSQDIREMGGVLKQMPVTGWTFIVASLALIGVPPFAGFFSKDDVLAVTHHHPLLFLLGTATAFLTAFYVTRLIVVAFPGSPSVDRKVRESPKVMTVPLIILALFSSIGGWLGAGCPVPFLGGLSIGFGSFVYAGTIPLAPEYHLDVMAISTLMVAAGAGAAWLIYRQHLLDSWFSAQWFRPLHRLLVMKYYMDEFYGWLIGVVQQGWAAFCFFFDRNFLIRFLVNGTAAITGWSGDRLRMLQTGTVHAVLLIMVAGTALLLLLVFRGGIG